MIRSGLRLHECGHDRNLYSYASPSVAVPTKATHILTTTMPPSSTPTSAGRQTTLLGFFNKPTPGGSQSKPNTPSSSSRPTPKTPTLGTSSKPVAGSKTKQSVSRTGSNSNVLQQQAQAQSQESPLGNKGKSRGLVRTLSDENKKKLGSSQSIWIRVWISVWI
jgi:hypothetical protein